MRLTISYRTLYFIAIGILLILIAGLRPIGIDRDSLAYASVLNISLSEANFLDKEPTFWIIVELNGILFERNPRTFFLIFAILGVTLKMLAIRRLSLSPFLSIITYICLYFVLHEMTQIRVGVASAIFLLAIPDIYNRNLKAFLFKTFLATLFHYSAIIMVITYFLDPKKIDFKFLLLPLIGVISALISLNIIPLLSFLVPLLPDFLSYKLSLYISLLNEGIHTEIDKFNIFYTSLLILFYLMFLYHSYLKSQYDILLLKIFSLMLFSFYFLSSFPVLAFRVSEFLGVVLIILLPHFTLAFKQKAITEFVLVLYLLIYFAFVTINQLLNLA